ncbi:MAG: hypothetical protein HFG34_02440 [Eubacterium sp.]|nr:hypothetical protein [Eubacterium sp.]
MVLVIIPYAAPVEASWAEDLDKCLGKDEQWQKSIKDCETIFNIGPLERSMNLLFPAVLFDLSVIYYAKERDDVK